MKKLSIILSICLLAACSVKPQQIDYGNDACHFCKMGIVDPQYSAELVTSKGKVFKFDAIECMINYKSQNESDSYAYELVSTYDNPGKLISVDEASFIISRKMPSPMGMYLTAFSKGIKVSDELLGDSSTRYNWDELNRSFEKIKISLNQHHHASH